MNNSDSTAGIDSNIATQRQSNNQESNRPQSGSHSPAVGAFGSQNPVTGDSPFDLSTYLAFPTANSGLGQSPNPVGEEVYKAFALGIKATQGDPSYKAPQLQSTSLSSQKQRVSKESPQDSQSAKSESDSSNTMNNQMMLDPRGKGNSQTVKATLNSNQTPQSTSSMLANLHDGSSGLSPYGLDPSAFQAEVRFQLPAFLNPTSTAPTHPNGAEVWSGYGLHSAAMEGFASAPRQQFGVSEFGENGGNTGFGMGSRFFGNSGDNGTGMNFGTAIDTSGQDGKWQSTMQMISNQQSQNGMNLPRSGQNMQSDAGFAHADGGGLAQWDNWSFNADSIKSSTSPGVFQYSADGTANGFQTQQTAAAPKNTKSDNAGNVAEAPRIQLTTGTNLTMPTSALLPTTRPSSASFPSSSAMAISSSKIHTGAPGNNDVADGAAGGIAHTADNVFASSSTSASAVAAQALANGPLGGLVQPGTFATQTPGGVNMPGLYSTTGFDMVSVLSKVAARRDPKSVLGPVDCSCSFVVVVRTLLWLSDFVLTRCAHQDIRKYDHPIVYSSPTFSTLTGYDNREIVGRNCRFLQSESLASSDAMDRSDHLPQVPTPRSSRALVESTPTTKRSHI